MSDLDTEFGAPTAGLGKSDLVQAMDQGEICAVPASDSSAAAGPIGGALSESPTEEPRERHLAPESGAVDPAPAHVPIDPMAPVLAVEQLHLRARKRRQDEYAELAELGPHAREILANLDSKAAFLRITEAWRRKAYQRQPTDWDPGELLTLIVRYSQEAVERVDAQKASRDARALSTLFAEGVPDSRFREELEERGLTQLASQAAERGNAKTQSGKQLPETAAQAEPGETSTSSATFTVSASAEPQEAFISPTTSTPSVAAAVGGGSATGATTENAARTSRVLEIEAALTEEQIARLHPGETLTLFSSRLLHDLTGRLKAIR